jgi:hypothetical protein
MKQKHLVFIIRKRFIEFRVGNQYGSHPCNDESVDSVINYLKCVIPHDTTEIITD